MRGTRLGLATGVDVCTSGEVPTSLCDALSQRHGGAREWELLAPDSAVEVMVAELMWVAWQGQFIAQPEYRGETSLRMAAQLHKALLLWRHGPFVDRAVARLQELRVQDFDPDDLKSALISPLANFYLNCPEGADGVQEGLKLLKE